MNVLVTGGAGYIGSQTCKVLAESKHYPVVVDSLELGRSEVVRWGPLYKLDVRDTASLREVLIKERIEAIIHLAAYSRVEESIFNPRKYLDNNVRGTLSILSAIVGTGVRNLLFSSSCAVYGSPAESVIDEKMDCCPVNPYGVSKVMAENLLKVASEQLGLSVMSLRYFNAAGLDAEATPGGLNQVETRLIPLVIRSSLEANSKFLINGSDYLTHDGTCIRDYIHIKDLGQAHLRALEQISESSPGYSVFNLGSGIGTSVLQVISEVESAVGRKISVEFGPRRLGDAPELIANWTSFSKLTGWRPNHSNLTEIVRSYLIGETLNQKSCFEFRPSGDALHEISLHSSGRGGLEMKLRENQGNASSGDLVSVR